MILLPAVTALLSTQLAGGGDTVDIVVCAFDSPEEPRAAS